MAQPARTAETTTWLNDKTTSKGSVLIKGKPVALKVALPHSEADERMVLGSILSAGLVGKGNENYRQVAASLKHTDFYFSRHAYIWRAMCKVVEEGGQIDSHAIIEQLKRHTNPKQNLLAEVGGERAILELANVRGTNLASYARNLLRHSLGRETILASKMIESLGSQVNTIDLDEFHAQVALSLRNVQLRMAMLSDQQRYDVAAHMSEYESDLRQRMKPDYKPGIPTGFAGLDKALIGLRESKLYLFAAPPGWGKTSWLLNLALNAVKQGKKVMFISLEMSYTDMMDRLVCMASGVNYTRLQQGSVLDAGECQSVFDATRRLQNWTTTGTFTIECMEQPTMREIEARLVEGKINQLYDVVFIDYIGEDTVSPGNEFLAQNTLKNVMDMYRELKRWKSEYAVPFVVASQMNQKWDSRKGKRPGMTDIFFGSGARFAADVIGFIYHEKMAVRDSVKDESEIILRKNRSGPAGDEATILIHWDPATQLFSDAHTPKPYIPATAGYTFGGVE